MSFNELHCDLLESAFGVGRRRVWKNAPSPGRCQPGFQGPAEGPQSQCGNKSRKNLRWRKTQHCFDRQGVRTASYIGIIQEKKKAVASTGFNAFVTANDYREDRMRGFLVVLTTLALVTVAASPARADDYVLTIKEHRFTPAEIKVPANQRVMITVINEDATAEEFDSGALKVEKVVAGKSKGTVRIGPLKPGRYPFIGEYNEATAKGTVIAE
jgi:cupredoxin-like protein